MFAWRMHAGGSRFVIRPPFPDGRQSSSKSVVCIDESPSSYITFLPTASNISIIAQEIQRLLGFSAHQLYFINIIIYRKEYNTYYAKL